MVKLYPHSVISRRGPIKRPRADCSLGSTLEAFFSASSRLASFLEITFPLLVAISLTFVFAQSVFSLFTLFDNPPLFSSFLGSFASPGFRTFILHLMIRFRIGLLRPARALPLLFRPFLIV